MPRIFFALFAVEDPFPVGVNNTGDPLRACDCRRDAVKWPRMTRRSAFVLGFVFATLPGLMPLWAEAATPAIDRHALVTRHDPVLHQFDAANPLSVGNGQFAFTVDATGLQTFADAFTNTTPLGTLSQW